jgi:hypothetical protein
MNVWMTSFSAVFFFASPSDLLWLGPTLRFALAGMAIEAFWLLGWIDAVGKPPGIFYTPSRWLALLVMLAIAARRLRMVAHHASPAPDDQH